METRHPAPEDAAFDEEVVDLLVETLRKKGTLALTPSGWSMFPVIFPGDSVLISACPTEGLRPGDVVWIRRRRGLTLHRVYRVARDAPAGEALVFTKGDGNLQPDAPVRAGDVAGKVVSCGRSASRRLLWRVSDAAMNCLILALVSPAGRRVRAILKGRFRDCFSGGHGL